MRYQYRLYKPGYKRLVRQKIRENEFEEACENILTNSLDPHQINNTFAAIREVNAAFAGKFHLLSAEYN